MIVHGAFTKGYPFNLEEFKKEYSSMERRENWFYRLLIRLRLRKPHRTALPEEYSALFKPGLKKEFELAYKAESLMPEEEDQSRTEP